MVISPNRCTRRGIKEEIRTKSEDMANLYNRHTKPLWKWEVQRLNLLTEEIEKKISKKGTLDEGVYSIEREIRTGYFKKEGKKLEITLEEPECPMHKYINLALTKIIQTS